MWNLNYNKKHTVKIYSDYSSIDTANDHINISSPVADDEILNHFDIEFSRNIEKIVDPYGTEYLTLSLTDKIINFIIDNSGSMSWKDPNGYRLDIIKDFINNLTSSYPKNIEYNIFEYGGKKVKFYFSAATMNDNPFAYNFNTSALFPQDAYIDKINNIFGIRVLRKMGGFSTTPIDGEIIFDGFSDKILDSGLIENNNYYYSVYTYDENFHFSDPSRVIVISNSEEIPIGIRNFNGEVLKGSSVIVDQYVKSIWHFNKNNDKLLYDFSSKADLSISGSGPYWINKDEVPIGDYGLRFNGIDNIAGILDSNNFNIYSVPFSIMGWIYPYDLSIGNAPILVRTNGVDVDWGVYLNNDKLRFNVNGTIIDSTGSLTVNEWNHICITVDAVGNSICYINGVNSGSSIVPSSSPFSSLNNMSLHMGGDGLIFFRGRLTEFSIHSINRDQNYVFSSSIESGSDDRDNGDRLIILKYSIPNDPSLVGGQIQIVKNDYNSSSNEQDGETIFSDFIVPGNFYTTYREDFVVNRNYNFRVFSKNTFGNYSNIFDSLNLEINIEGMSAEALQNISSTKNINSPNSVILVAGNNKNHIKWHSDDFGDEEKRIVIYYSKESYPNIDNDIISGIKIFEGDSTEKYFVHNELKNEIPYYYSIFSIDKYERASVIVNINGTPLSTNNNLDIPTKKISGLSYEIEKNNSIELFWDSPTKHRIIEGFFDDSIVIFAKITDEFGDIIEEDLKISLDIQIEKIIEEDIGEDVFAGETSFIPPVDNLLYSFVMSEMESGYASGVFSLRMTGLNAEDLLLKNIKGINVTITPRFYILGSDGVSVLFENKAYPLELRLTNPFDLSVQNLDKQFVNILCKKNISQLENDVKEIKIYNGSYIGASRVFTLRSLLSYKGLPNIGVDAINVKIYNADKDLCSNNNPIATTENTNIEATTGLIFTNTEEIEQLDANNDPTGIFTLSKYADISIKPPDLPAKLLVYIKATLKGFSFVKRFFVVFDNTLKIELIPTIPITNGIDTAEQSANVYLVDPDSSEDITKRIYPVDDTIVEWSLVKNNDSFPDRDMFSIDNVPISDGIYSYVMDGVADNVFIGPITNPILVSYVDNQPVYEEHLLTAKVIYGELSAEDSATLSIKPICYDNQESSSSYFLMEFENIKEEIYNDGIDYVKATISHNADTSTTKYSDCFRECLLSLGKIIYELQPGQLVYIYSQDPNVEIIWGSVIEETDPLTGQKTLDTTNATMELGSAYVELSDNDHTDVFFRINHINGPSLGVSGSGMDANNDSIVDQSDLNLLLDNWNNILQNDSGDFNNDEDVDVEDLILLSSVWQKSTQGILEEQLKIEEQYSIGSENIKPICSCIRESSTISYKNEIIISGSITSIFEGKTVSLFGGGSLSAGIPSTILIPRDSLNISLVDKKVDDISVNNIAIDGESENELIFDVSYSGYPVLDSTTVFCQSFNYGDKVLNVKDTINYTSQYIYEDYSGDIRSYVSIKLQSIPKNRTFKSDLYVIVSYDVGLEINRIKILKLKFYFDKEDTKNNNAEIFSKDVYRIRTALPNSNWEKVSDLNTPRSLFASETINNKIYAIGGINSNIVLGSVEEYCPVSNIWVYKRNMPVKRFAPSSIVDGNYIYIFGGIEYNVLENKLYVSRSVERYDTSNNTWATLSSLPSVNDTASPVLYGNAFGISEKYGDDIYILSGIRDISFDGKTMIFNDRVLRYNIATDTWTYSDIISSEFNFYKKLSPYGFVKNDDIYVFGGLSNKNIISTNIFKYNITTETLETSDNDFYNIFIPRYKSGYLSFSDKLYVVGGEKEGYEYSRDFDTIDYSIVPFSSSVNSQIISGLNGCGLNNGNNGISDYLYVIGGEKSSKTSGFLIIDSKIGSSDFSLDNKQGVNLQIQLFNENGEYASNDVDLHFRGYVQIYTEENDETFIIPTKLTKYNVIMEPSEIIVSNGFGNVNLRSRSDDVLNEIFNYISFNDNEKNIKYRIVPQVSVVSNEYYGQNFISIMDNISIPPVFNLITESDINNNNTIKQLTKNLDNILSDKLYQNNAAYIDCKSVSPNVSFITQLTDDVVGSIAAIVAINNISDSFGVSPLLDTIQESSLILSKEVYDDIDKIIMVFCDSEHNCSLFSLSQSIDAILNIGEKNVPTIISNISLLDDISQVDSIASEEINIHDYNLICSSSGGQSLTLNNIGSINNYIGLLTGGIVGSIGFGYATCIFDLSEKYKINTVSSDFDITDGSFGRWQISFSEDKYNFTQLSEYFSYSGIVDFDDIFAKYIRITFQLFSGNNYGPFMSMFNLPSVLDVFINFVKSKIDYIFVDPKNTDGEIQEIIVSTNNRNTIFNNSIIENGISLSTSSCNWEDFSGFSIPTKDKAGKFIIPKRSGEITAAITGDTKVEPLIRVDGFLYKTTYGPWDENSVAEIYDLSGNLIVGSTYIKYPRKGEIVFKSKKYIDYIINITNENRFRIGNKITNYETNEIIEIYGWGYIYKEKI